MAAAAAAAAAIIIKSSRGLVSTKIVASANFQVQISASNNMSKMVGASATQVGVYFMTLTSCSIMVWNRFWVQSSRSLDWKVSKSRVSTPQTYLRLQPFWVVGYWHQRANERHGNPPQGNQELLVIRDKVGRRPGELWVSKSMECDIFPSVSALTLSVG